MNIATIRVSASRKIADGHYGSVGIEYAVEISLGDGEDPRALIDQWSGDLAAQAQRHVDRELSEIELSRPDPVPPREVERQPDHDRWGDRRREERRPERAPIVARGTEYRDRGEPIPPRDRDRDRDRNGHSNGHAANREEAPRSGAQLLGWAKKQGRDVGNFVFTEGKRLGLPGRVVDWDPQDVDDVYRAALRF